MPVWEHAGIICAGETHKSIVKLTFAKGVAQPDLSNLLSGKLRGFSVECLLHMIAALGRDIEIVVKPAKRSKEPGGIRFRRAAA